VIVAWVLLVAVMVAFAPSLSRVGVTEQETFLPTNSPSVQAGKLIHEKFPQDSAVGDTIVFFRTAGLTQADMDYARQVGEWLQTAEAPEEVADVISVFSRPELAPMLRSPDGTTLLMSIKFLTSVSSVPTNRAVDAIRAHLAAPQSGLEVYTAGSASIARDTLETIKRSLDRTTWATVLLVIVILLIIYRSPVASLVPLTTITAAYLVSRGALGFLAQAGIKMSTQMDIFTVVVVFGVGTDYCLFIVSRYREELHRLPTRFEAGVRTMEKIGAVIAASAAVVILAFLFLNVANFGLTRTLGTGLAVAIFATLLAGLTLTPALMAVMGANLFWPFSHHQQRPEHGFWHRLAVSVSRNARWVVPAIVVVLLIPYVFLPGIVRSFDILADVPADMDSAKGFETLKGHFDPGEILPTTVMLVAEDGRVEDHLAAVDSLASELRAVPGVTRVRSLLAPTGDPVETALFLVDRQMMMLADGIAELRVALGGGAGDGASVSDPISAMEAILAYLKDLAAAYPSVKDALEYNAALAQAQALSGRVAYLETQMRVTTQLETVAEQVGMLALGLQSPIFVSEPQSLAEQAAKLGLLKRYLSGLGGAFPFLKLDVNYTAALASLDGIEEGLAQVQRGLYVSGQLSIIADALDELAKKLDNPMAVLQMGTSDDLTALQDYMVELAQRYSWIASDASFSQIQQHVAVISVAAMKLQSGQVAAADLSAALTALKSELGGMSGAVRGLSAAFAARQPTATFIPKQVPSGMMQPSDMRSQVEGLGVALLELVRAFAATQPGARYMAADLLSGTDLTQMSAALGGDLHALSQSLATLGKRFEGTRTYFYPKALLKLYPGAGSLERVFVSADGTATRLYAILEPEPYSNEALDVSLDIRKAAAAVVKGTGTEVYITGSSAAFADIRQVSNEDFVKVLILTSLGVLAVMILLLRSVAAPIYLMLTVLLSYGSTMGVTVLVFQVLLRHSGVNLLIPTIVLVLLVALGSDYNIFLMSRVREETAGVDFVDGLVHATSRTGAIISSCGIVLAGTFATMMLSPMTMLLQIGASVAFGVLLDTFVIRGVLVPGIARLLTRWNWWPARQ
jgi:RND superfamily putative drug exporter